MITVFSQPSVRVGILVVSMLAQVPSVQGQLFGEGGLFGRNDRPTRTPTEDEVGVPTPKTGRIQVVKGQQVQFEIEAVSKARGAAVEFLIRTMPTAGKIVSLVENPNARNRAIVTYYADPSTSAESDVFGFAVRYRGGRYSSEMRFDIDLVEVNAEIQSESEVDFGEALIGNEVVREIPVRNLGNGEFRRQIYLTPPWRIVEPANGLLLISPKQTRMVKVGFRPTGIGDTTYFLSFSRSREAMTKLIASGVRPFGIATEEVRLELDRKSGIRKGDVVLENFTGKPLRLSLRGSSRIVNGLPGMVIVPADKPYPISVELPETDVDPFDGMLQVFQESGFSADARLVAAVVPGNLKITMPNSKVTDVINYGRVTSGKSTERGFRITNTGGVPVPLEFHIPDPFRLLSDPGPQLAPKASVSLALGLFPADSRKGPVDVNMSVFGNDQELPIRLLANVIPPEGGLVGGSDPSSNILDRLGNLRMNSGKPKEEKKAPFISTPMEIVPAGKETVGIGSKPEKSEFLPGVDVYPIVERVQNPELRSPEDLALVESGSRSLTIGWTAPPDSELSEFEIELLGVTYAEGIDNPKTVWVPITGVEFDRVDRLVKAKIDGLTPFAAYYMRVFTVDENGRASSPSETMEVSTKAPMDWTYIYLGLGIVLLIFLGIGVGIVMKNRRPEVYQRKYADA